MTIKHFFWILLITFLFGSSYPVGKLIFNNELIHFKTFIEMKEFIIEKLNDKCVYLENIIFSNNKEKI